MYSYVNEHEGWQAAGKCIDEAVNVFGDLLSDVDTEMQELSQEYRSSYTISDVIEEKDKSVLGQALQHTYHRGKVLHDCAFEKGKSFIEMDYQPALQAIVDSEFSHAVFYKGKTVIENRVKVADRLVDTVGGLVENKVTNNIDEISQLAAEPYKGGRTRADFSLDKHSQREGSIYSSSSRKARVQNKKAQDIVDGILTTPETKLINKTAKKNGQTVPVVDAVAPDGRII
ncbi:hypothetical protein [Pseudoalteromonas luteoviolacea]|uniref:hypothetical protein n=1 Tax=Pseudoalteromonas luteoviolacea TaxID=43657 RepID=UPI0012DAE246|nr:hypothetical protein [Pseudoalteromonas luteoviolacea]